MDHLGLDQIFGLNVTAVLAIAAFTFFMAPRERLIYAGFALYVTGWVSVMGWAIYAVVHFVSRYW